MENIKEKLKVLIENIKEKNIDDYKELIKNKRSVIIGMVTAVLLISTIIIYSNVDSKEEVLKKLQISLSEGKPQKIKDSIKLDDESINRKSIEPFINYYNKNGALISNLISELRSKGISSVVEVKSKGLLFWEDYYINLHPVSIKIDSNFNEGEFFIGDKKIANNGMAISLVPGLYNVKGKLVTKYGDVISEKSIPLMQNDKVSINFEAVKFTITSPYKDAKVFINKEYSGKTVGEIGEVGPVPSNSSIGVSIEKEFPWGVIKSEEKKVSNIPNIILDINMTNDRLINDIEKKLNDFYISTFEALNNKNKELIIGTKEDAKNKIYENIEKKSLLFKNNYEISDLNMKIESSEFTYQEDKYKAKIVVNLNYNIYKKLLPFVNENKDELFLTSLVYEEDTWLVEDVQRFSEE